MRNDCHAFGVPKLRVQCLKWQNYEDTTLEVSWAEQTEAVVLAGGTSRLSSRTRNLLL
jgi:hypothetical protein